MANSLEVRPVLLDHKLAEFVFALPSRLKLSQTMNKPTLVGALGDLLPDVLIHRAKMGFELPLLEWLSGPLQDRARSAFSSQVAKAIFSPRFLQQTTDNLRAKQCSSIAVWAYFNLLEWLQTYRGEF
jgi:asparagine synthase (glutamine-hydrolysing)